METLLNLVWMGVCCFLVAVWACGHGVVREDDCLLPQRRTQITALVLLVVILFPVISLTDDLMMSSTPAESEHAWRLDLRPDPISPMPPAIPSVLAALTLMVRADDRYISEQVPSVHVCPAHSLGFYRPIENRPPPAA